MRTDFSPTDTSALGFYRLLTAVAVPRPIAWVSSVSPEGANNLAPHSFRTVASTNPPIVQFTSMGERIRSANKESPAVLECRLHSVLPTGRLHPGLVSLEMLRQQATWAREQGFYAAFGERNEDVGFHQRTRVRPGRAARLRRRPRIPKPADSPRGRGTAGPRGGPRSPRIKPGAGVCRHPCGWLTLLPTGRACRRCPVLKVAYNVKWP